MSNYKTVIGSNLIKTKGSSPTKAVSIPWLVLPSL